MSKSRTQIFQENKDAIIDALGESLYMDYDIEGAKENLNAINDGRQIVELLNAIQTVEMFFNGDLNEE